MKLIGTHLLKYLFYIFITGIMIVGGASPWLVCCVGFLIVILFDFYSLK